MLPFFEGKGVGSCLSEFGVHVRQMGHGAEKNCMQLLFLTRIPMERSVSTHDNPQRKIDATHLTNLTCVLRSKRHLLLMV